MLTDLEMLEIAKRYLERVGNGIEIEIILEATLKKPYGNIYHYNSKKFFETGNFMDGIAGCYPFMVEKNLRRVLQFESVMGLEYQISAYENNTLNTSGDAYWYPDEDRFSDE